MWLQLLGSGISNCELSPADVTVTLQTPASVMEGTNIVVTVELSNVSPGSLEVDLTVTLSATPGTASENMLCLLYY